MLLNQNYLNKTLCVKLLCLLFNISIHHFLFNYRLKPLDIELMKKLHNKVNIVPVIAKSDVLTKKEVQKLKKRVII